MTARDEFRSDMNAYRRLANDEARSFKDSNRVAEKLNEQLSLHDQDLADQVPAEWALSDDEATRFDALALIDEFKLMAALPVLDRLAMRLVSAKEPSAPFELKKVDRIVNRLRG